jgi:glucose/arabinose dehydrogenase
MTAWFRCLHSGTTLRRLPWGFVAASLVACDSATAGNSQTPNVELAADVVATGLDTVWELAWGPDDFIWITERGGRISRLDPQSGTVTPAGQVAVSEIGEGGLMGLAFHPDFASQPWVYVAHTYSAQGGRETASSGCALTEPLWPPGLLADIPDRPFSNGSRLVVDLIACCISRPVTRRMPLLRRTAMHWLGRFSG